LATEEEIDAFRKKGPKGTTKEECEDVMGEAKIDLAGF